MTDRTTLGILLMIGFSIVAPVMDSFAKATPEEVPVLQILAARFGIQAFLLLPIAFWMQHAHRPGRGELGLHVVRALLILVATGCFFTALRFMPIANAIAIFFVEPFILTLMGGLFLGEAIGPRRIIACLVGFAGAMLVIQPSFADLGPVTLLPIVTAFCFAFYMVLTRQMATRTHPLALQGYTAIAAMLFIVPLLWGFDGSDIAALDPVWPRGLAVWTLLGVGIVSTISHLFISFALRFTPAATIAPLQYLEIVFATILGYYIFADIPDRLTVLGATIIVGSGLYVFARERALGRPARRPPPAP
ncbi:DMT family transporter [Aquicoccus porphyridii]|uniref:DMT family transporter n=1 Tax=Aquicoccus porphyridii TaxID=1852029 RepID=A0A5A9ZFJ4_9RHOB|nr:DMT family transporter [Aquicoccus porphyridii]KAA0916048.1 DMT family transporter [Aquicoccus porphyridii]RAI52689.1 EamA/RhaT family transporter [Rhodobacteraceae bacterium AsT-22]